MTFECPRCGYTTSSKSNFVQHIYHKTICLLAKSDVNLDIIRRDYNEKKHFCQTCSAVYQNASGLSRHKTICNEQQPSQDLHKFSVEVLSEIKKILNQNNSEFDEQNHTAYRQTIKELQQQHEDDEKKIQEFKAEIMELRKSMIASSQANISNTTNNNNNTINITINNYGEESYDNLTPKDLIQYFLWYDVVGFIKDLHFDPLQPCNHNIEYIGDSLKKFCNGKWVTKNWKTGIFELLKDKARFLKQVPNKYKDAYQTLFKDPSIDDFSSQEEHDDAVEELDNIIHEVNDKVEVDLFFKLEKMLYNENKNTDSS